MRYRRTRRPRKRILVGVLLLCGLILWILWLGIRIREPFSAACTHVIRQDATRILVESTEHALQQTREEQGEFAAIVKNESGEIVSVELLSGAVSRFQNQVTGRVNEALNQYASSRVSVPLGSASGMTLLAGRGPNVQVQVRPAGSVQTELLTQFTQAGINQTCHQILLRLTLTLDVAAPLQCQPVTFTYTCLLSETIIVGKTPDGIWAP